MSGEPPAWVVPASDGPSAKIPPPAVRDQTGHSHRMMPFYYPRPWVSLILVNSYAFVILKRRELPTTLTELRTMAAAPINGDSKRPKVG